MYRKNPVVKAPGKKLDGDCPKMYRKNPVVKAPGKLLNGKMPQDV